MKMYTLFGLVSILAGMPLNAAEAFASSSVLLALPIAQVPGALRDGFQAGLGIMFLAGFLWGVVKIWNGADKMSKGDADGKMGIIAGIIIAGAAAIMAALFAIFGMSGGALVPTF